MTMTIPRSSMAMQPWRSWWRKYASNPFTVAAMSAAVMLLFQDRLCMEIACG